MLRNLLPRDLLPASYLEEASGVVLPSAIGEVDLELVHRAQNRHHRLQSVDYYQLSDILSDISIENMGFQINEYLSEPQTLRYRF